MSLYRPETHGANPYYYGQDPGVGSLYWIANSYWFLGHPEKALISATEALKIAQNLSNAFNIAIALTLLAQIHHHRGEAGESKKYAEQAIELSRKHDLELCLDLAILIRACALVEGGDAEMGAAEITKGLSGWKKTGAEFFVHYWYGLLSLAYANSGSQRAAMDALDNAFETSRKSGEAFYLAELHRLKGEFLAQDKPSAEASMRKALEIAREQGAKSLELRAALSLARLLEGDRQALKSLADIYHDFTESLDTKDLKDTREYLVSHDKAPREP